MFNIPEIVTDRALIPKCWPLLTHKNYCDCEMRNTGAALTTTCQSGTRVYRRGTGSGWPPLGVGATTGAKR